MRAYLISVHEFISLCVCACVCTSAQLLRDGALPDPRPELLQAVQALDPEVRPCTPPTCVFAV
eukprot:6195170-Pleurochrysis_carterae.AAC.5